MKVGRYTYILFTVTIATPAVFTSAGHELAIGDTVQLATTDALPTGLAVNTTYYVIQYGMTSSTFQLSASNGGTAINTTGSQSGSHTWIKTNLAKLVPNIEDNK